ncbi:50S ribosomal protein L7/L12-like [Salvia splendens]|nr:50S ribosomal protein L7/L12-like [Salvia splendens]XP_042028885.1 50S ribosomal protein L7/L12-like [Salvia splendens]
MSLISKLRHVRPPCVRAIRSTTNRHFTQTATSQGENEDEFVEFDQRMLPADYDPASFNPTDHRAPPTTRVWGLVDQVCGLTLAEYNQLSTIMMEKFCFTMMKKLTMKERFEIMARIQSADAEAAAEAAAGKGENMAEKSTFEVKMESYEVASKLKIIKELWTFMDLGLKEAKDLVEKTPAVLKKGLLKEEAEKIVEKMKALGAKVIMV